MIHKKQFGFTLMELMITVAIIGILATIAIPSYQDSVSKSRRRDAEGVLLNLSNAMERHFTETNSYCDVGTGAAVADCGGADNDTGTPITDLFSIPTETSQFYIITISAVAPGSFTLSAVPTGAQAGDKCATLSLRHTGEKIISASSPVTVDDCW